MTVEASSTRVTHWLRRCVEPCAAFLVALEVLVLFAGVIARYAFNAPLTWSDELAQGLFLWLALAGAVVALARGEHMRLASLVQGLSPGASACVSALTGAAMIVFLAALAPMAYQYVVDQWDITTPALELHDGLRVAAILFATLVMLAELLARQLGRQHRMAGVSAIMGCAVAAAALWILRGHIAALGNLNLVLFFVIGTGALVLLGMPIAFAFGIATFTYLGLATDTPLTVFVSRLDEGMSSLVLLAVPMFVFLGLLIEMTGLAAALVEFLAAIVGHARGGLAYVLIGAMYLVSGISGSKAADMAAVAPALIPEMKARGANEGRIIALLAASGAMSETIPPSLVLITIGSVTGASIAALFGAGLVPAGVGAIALTIVVAIQHRRDSTPVQVRASGRLIATRFVWAVPALALPVMIRTAVVSGVATATEVSTLGVFYAALAGLFVYRRFDWRRLYPMLVETASLSGAILFIIGCATAMAWALTQSGFSHQLAQSMASVPGGRAGFMAISVVAFVVLGSVLEGIPAIVLFGPLLFPIAGALGINQVHYAMVVVFAMGLGLFAPPLGVGFYAACAIGRVDPRRAAGAIWPYLAALALSLVAIASAPMLAGVGR